MTQSEGSFDAASPSALLQPPKKAGAAEAADIGWTRRCATWAGAYLAAPLQNRPFGISRRLAGRALSCSGVSAALCVIVVSIGGFAVAVTSAGRVTVS